MTYCTSCQREKPDSEFGLNSALPSKKNRYCKPCVRKRGNDYYLLTMQQKVRRKYDGRCAICKSNEDLEIHSMIDGKRRYWRAMILLCPKCYSEGMPRVTSFIRDCFRCGHRWIGRKRSAIKCPKCDSPYWFRPKSAERT